MLYYIYPNKCILLLTMHFIPIDFIITIYLNAVVINTTVYLIYTYKPGNLRNLKKDWPVKLNLEFNTSLLFRN